MRHTSHAPPLIRWIGIGLLALAGGLPARALTNTAQLAAAAGGRLAGGGFTVVSAVGQGVAPALLTHAARVVQAGFLPVALAGGDSERLLAVRSEGRSGVPVYVAPADRTGAGNGLTDFSRSYTNDCRVTLSAPARFNGGVLTGWRGVDLADGTNAGLNVTSALVTVTVIYRAPPPAPAALTASDGAFTDRVRLAWSAAPGADSYQVWRSTNGSLASAALWAGGLTDLTHDDRLAQPNVLYYYWVTASNVAGYGTASPRDSGYASSVTAPDAPDGLAASDGLYTNRVALQWNPVAGAAGYEVWRATDGNPASAARLRGGLAGTAYDDTAAAADTLYYYWVTASNAGGRSGFSNRDAGFRSSIAAPETPAAVQASDGAFTNRVRVTWTAGGVAAGHEIWRGTNALLAQAALLASLPAGASYDDGSAVPGQIYYYWVRATNAAGSSGFSAPDSGFAARTPLNLLRPANGGRLLSYTSQNWPGSAWGAASNLTDGRVTGGDWSWFWISEAAPARPQEFVYAFSNDAAAVLSSVVIYNYGQGDLNRYGRDYEIWTSVDGTSYVRQAQGRLAAQTAPQEIALAGVEARRLKVRITGGYDPLFWELAELQAWGSLAVAQDRTAPHPGTPAAPAATESLPIRITYAGAADNEGGSGLKQVELWARLDGGTWADTGLRQARASGAFDFQAANGAGTYAFHLVAEDQAGNRSAPAAGTGMCQTVYAPAASVLNLLRPAAGGRLVSYTSQSWPGSTWGAAASLTDGRTTGTDWTWFWISEYAPARPQEFVYAFSNDRPATLTRVVIHNYGQGELNRYAKGYEIWVSADGSTYTRAAQGQLAAQTGAQEIALGGAGARRLKLVVTGGYDPLFWELAEVEAYGVLAANGAPPADAGRAAVPAPQVTPSAPAKPRIWVSGTPADDPAPACMLDGNPATAWAGDPAADRWQIGLDWGVATDLTCFRVDLAEPWPDSLALVGSRDGLAWFDVTAVPEGETPQARYVFLYFWATAPGTGAPRVTEIRWDKTGDGD